MSDRAAHGTSPLVRTTADDVRDLFLSAPAALRRYKKWCADPRRGKVRALVEGHVTDVLYRLTPNDVLTTCENTDHALGEIKKRDVQKISEVEDWNPDFAFTHLLHYQLEKVGHVPTWQEFRNFLLNTPDGREKLGDEAYRLRDDLVRSGTRKDVAKAAIQWRIGNAYYGILRDIYTVVRMRASGLDVRSHPLADALFLADGWVDRTVICLRIANARYRDNQSGRKTRAEALLADAPLSFRFETVQLLAPDTFGEVRLPADIDVEDAVKHLRNHHARPLHPGRG